MGEDDGHHFRREGRKPLSVRVTFRRPREGTTLEHTGVTHDLNMTGAFIETEHAPVVGERLALVMSVPTSWEPLELTGEVRWVTEGNEQEPAGFGVRFRAPDGAAATALYELVHANTFAEPRT